MQPAPPAEHPVAVVTGAGSGIGLALATQLASIGHHVVLVGRDTVKLKTAAESIDGPTTVHPADIGDQTQARALIDRVASTFQRLDVLVNNAGAAPLKPVEQTTDADFEHTFRVNAIGPASLIAHAWSLFRRTPNACIINISTLGTRDPFPGFFAYAASKSALNSMTRSCVVEGAEFGLRAFTIAPGAVETTMLRSLFSQDQISPAICHQPDEIARVAIDCIRGKRDQDNGSVIWLPNDKAHTA